MIKELETSSPSWRDSRTVSRSARRQTVRARWMCAAARVPPGRMNCGQRLQLGFECVDRGLETCDVVAGDGVVKWTAGRRVGKGRADDKQLLLELRGQPVEPLGPAREPAPGRGRR